MAFKLKFQGKSKELYGSDNTMVRKGLVTPAYLMEGPGDEVKVSSSSGSSQSGRKLTEAELAAKQRELHKKVSLVNLESILIINNKELSHQIIITQHFQLNSFRLLR